MKDYSKNSSVKIELMDLVMCSYQTQWLVRGWRNREDIRKWMDTRQEISTEEHAFWLNKLIGDGTQKQFVVFADSDPVGVVGFQKINPDHGTCYEHIYMAEAKGIAVRAENLAMEWLFTNTDIEKCILYFYDGNPVYYVYLKTGFCIEGRITSFATMDGKRVDVIFMGQSRDEWQDRRKSRISLPSMDINGPEARLCT